MGLGKKIKLALCEVLQFAGLCVPIFIIMQRFASIIHRVKSQAQPPGDANTAYWLIVASSIAYVTSVALVVWVPMKFMVCKKKKFFTGRKKCWGVGVSVGVYRMGLGKKIKLALCEVLQFAGLCVPIFIIMQRFASIIHRVKSQAQPPGDANTAYWLIVASSIAYVTSVALVVWVPMKFMVFKKRKFFTGRKKWRPVTLAYVILSTLPCFAFLIASSEVQISNNMQYDTFTELPVSLVLFSLICVDIIERIRHCRLTGQASEHERETDIPPSILTRVDPVVPVMTVAGQLSSNREHNGASSRLEANGFVPGFPGPQERHFSIAGLGPHRDSFAYHLSPYPYSGPLRFLCASDMRAEIFVESFIFWFDTVEMVRVAGHPLVYYSGWVFPIYIFSFLSVLRLILTPCSPLLSSLGVALQDLPFLFIRISLIAIFGFVTPLLYLMKNLLVSMAYIYFNFMTKLRIFNTERMF